MLHTYRLDPHNSILLFCIYLLYFGPGLVKIPPAILIGIIAQILLYTGVIQGSYLEPIYGTTNFGLLLIILSIGCSAIYVSLGYILIQLTGDYGYFTTCAIGFSATLFALKVVALCEERNRLHNINGFIVPSKLAVWFELILIHLLVPNSSFIGHLSGILVGCLYSYIFVGEIIDNLIHAITGTPIIHEEQFYRRRNRLFT